MPKTSRDTDQTDQSASRQRGVNKSKKKQDFVKKNIELAKDAGNAVLMTDDEKRRLAELLKDIGEDGSTNLPSDEGNPSQWAVSLTPGEGYTPEPSEQHYLTIINCKLQALLSAEDYSALHSPYSSCRQLQVRACGILPATEPLADHSRHLVLKCRFRGNGCVHLIIPLEGEELPSREPEGEEPPSREPEGELLPSQEPEGEPLPS
ncbi:UNVERIFIED_CONTAM: hypothetical protein FKN15_073062 [Acipenser sinensis]